MLINWLIIYLIVNLLLVLYLMGTSNATGWKWTFREFKLNLPATPGDIASAIFLTPFAVIIVIVIQILSRITDKRRSR